MNTGIVAAVLALAKALDQKGVLKYDEYRAELVRLYEEMPEADAGGGAGLIFDGILSMLDGEIRNRDVGNLGHTTRYARGL